MEITDAMLDVRPSGHCQAKTKDGRPCRAIPLAGEPFCIFHSKSKRGKEARQKGIQRGHSPITRRELLVKLTNNLKEVPKLRLSPYERIKLEAQLGAQIHKLLAEVEKISELERLVKKHAVQQD